MYQKESFNVVGAQEKLEALKGTFAFPKSGDVTEVNNELEKVIFALKIYGAAPKHVLTRALYTDNEPNVLTSAKFVVRPSVHHELAVADLKKSFTINAGEDFFDKFIAEMILWFDTYQYHKQLQENVDVLNGVVSELINENELPFSVQFSLGEGLLDASDNHAIVGLDATVIEALAELPLFDERMESRVAGYKARILETLKEVTKPYEIVKVKSNVTKDLGIYSRKALNKLMRKFVSRKIEHTRVGTGYVDTDQYFAIIDKVAVTEAALAEMDTTDAVVTDNTGASSKEKEAGKTKIVATYRVAPFSKETGESTDVKLEQVI